MFSPAGPYCNVPEEDKEEILLMDFPGEYTTEDDVIIAAVAKLRTLYHSPTYQYYLDNKLLLEKLGKFARTTNITTGRDGNLSALSAQIKTVGKTIQEFKQLERIVLQELNEGKTHVKGGKRLAYDQS